LLLILRF